MVRVCLLKASLHDGACRGGGPQVGRVAAASARHRARGAPGTGPEVAKTHLQQEPGAGCAGSGGSSWNSLLDKMFHGHHRRGLEPPQVLEFRPRFPGERPPFPAHLARQVGAPAATTPGRVASPATAPSGQSRAPAATSSHWEASRRPWCKPPDSWAAWCKENAVQGPKSQVSGPRGPDSLHWRALAGGPLQIQPLALNLRPTFAAGTCISGMLLVVSGKLSPTGLVGRAVLGSHGAAKRSGRFPPGSHGRRAGHRSAGPMVWRSFQVASIRRRPGVRGRSVESTTSRRRGPGEGSRPSRARTWKLRYTMNRTRKARRGGRALARGRLARPQGKRSLSSTSPAKDVPRRGARRKGRVEPFDPGIGLGAASLLGLQRGSPCLRSPSSGLSAFAPLAVATPVPGVRARGGRSESATPERFRADCRRRRGVACRLQTVAPASHRCRLPHPVLPHPGSRPVFTR